MDVTPESRYGDLTRQLAEYGDPAGVRALIREMGTEVASATLVDGVLALIAAGDLAGADKAVRHAVHAGVGGAVDIASGFYEAGLVEGARRAAKTRRRVSKKP